MAHGQLVADSFVVGVNHLLYSHRSASSIQHHDEEDIRKELLPVDYGALWNGSVRYFSNQECGGAPGRPLFPWVSISQSSASCSVSADTKDSIPEAGVVPTCLMYFTFWYKPSERAFRLGIFHAANSLASGVGGFLAVGIDKVGSQISRHVRSYQLTGHSSTEELDSSRGGGSSSSKA